MRERIDALRCKVLGRPAIVALLTAFILRPPGLRGIFGWLDWAMTLGRIATALLAAVFFLARPRLSAATVAVGAYYVVALASTLINHGDLGRYGMFIDYVNIGAVCLLVDQGVDTDPKALVRGVAYWLGLMCTANLLSVVLTKCGVGYYVGQVDTYLMGLDNNHSFFIIPLLPAALLCARERRWPVWAQAALLALFAASTYITWPASAVVSISAFLVLFALWHVKDSWRVCNVGTYYAAIAVLFLLVVLLQNTGWFSFLIENVLHKDLTLSNRTPIWRLSISYILENPLLGVGMNERQTVLAMIGGINSHNIYLQVPFETGFVGSAVFLTMLGLLVRPLMRTRKSFGGYMLAAGLFAYLLMLEAEGLVWQPPFYLLVVLCCHAEKIVPALEPPPD